MDESIQLSQHIQLVVRGSEQVDNLVIVLLISSLQIGQSLLDVSLITGVNSIKKCLDSSRRVSNDTFQVSLNSSEICILSSNQIAESLNSSIYSLDFVQNVSQLIGDSLQVVSCELILVIDSCKNFLQFACQFLIMSIFNGTLQLCQQSCVIALQTIDDVLSIFCRSRLQSKNSIVQSINNSSATIILIIDSIDGLIELINNLVVQSIDCSNYLIQLSRKFSKFLLVVQVTLFELIHDSGQFTLQSIITISNGFQNCIKLIILLTFNGLKNLLNQSVGVRKIHTGDYDILTRARLAGIYVKCLLLTASKRKRTNNYCSQRQLSAKSAEKIKIHTLIN